MLIQAKILIGEHYHRNKNDEIEKYVVGDIAPVPESLVKDMPLKFQVIKDVEVKEKPEEKPKEVEEEKKEEKVVENPVDEDPKLKEKKIAELIEEGEVVNEDGFPVAFIPKKTTEEFDNLPEDTVFPYNYNKRTQWHYVSNGMKVMGTKKAERVQKLIDLIYGK